MEHLVNCVREEKQVHRSYVFHMKAVWLRERILDLMSQTYLLRRVSFSGVEIQVATASEFEHVERYGTNFDRL